MSSSLTLSLSFSVGVPKDDIGLTVGEDFIILQCIKPESQKELKGFYYQNERHFGNFYRCVSDKEERRERRRDRGDRGMVQVFSRKRVSGKKTGHRMLKFFCAEN